MSRLISLAGRFPTRYGVPVIARVDPTVFTRRYFTHCLQCGFCDDWCCRHGVDVDVLHRDAIHRHADALERYVGVPRTEWFTGEIEEDEEVPGGGATRTAVVEGRCVFLNRAGRGCRLHAFCLERGIDYHDLKSLVDCLFPITFEGDVLCPADEVVDGTLVCLDTGPSLYRGLRDEIRYYFGDALVDALDHAERGVLAEPARPTLE